jgi:predicted NAD/FAD-dependent oxidoreductase
LRELFVMDTSLQLAAVGDWCLGGRVENAYLSGSALGRAIRALM